VLEVLRGNLVKGAAPGPCGKSTYGKTRACDHTKEMRSLGHNIDAFFSDTCEPALTSHRVHQSMPSQGILAAVLTYPISQQRLPDFPIPKESGASGSLRFWKRIEKSSWLGTCLQSRSMSAQLKCGLDCFVIHSLLGSSPPSSWSTPVHLGLAFELARDPTVDFPAQFQPIPTSFIKKSNPCRALLQEN
jgi:hypothetical protein